MLWFVSLVYHLRNITTLVKIVLGFSYSICINLQLHWHFHNICHCDLYWKSRFQYSTVSPSLTRKEANIKFLLVVPKELMMAIFIWWKDVHPDVIFIWWKDVHPDVIFIWWKVVHPDVAALDAKNVSAMSSKNVSSDVSDISTRRRSWRLFRKVSFLRLFSHAVISCANQTWSSVRKLKEKETWSSRFLRRHVWRIFRKT